MTLLTEQAPILSWHQPQWAMITHALMNDTMPPAMLLKGEEGLGQAQFAEQLAMRLLCQQPKGIEACQQCSSCQLIKYGHHPDYFYITPPEKSKSIGIDQVRQLSQKLQQSAHHGRYQVVVLNPMAALTMGAANALLKTLEEPQGEVIMIGVMFDHQRLLPTLLSRMVILPFYASNFPDDSATHLSQAGEHQSLLQQVWGGAPLKCAQAVDEEAWVLAMAVLDHCGKCIVPRHSALHNSTFWSKQSAKEVLLWFYMMVSDAIRLQLGLSLESCAFVNAPKKIGYIAKCLSLPAWFELLHALESAIADAQSATAFNEQYLMEKMFVMLQNKALAQKN